MSLPLPEVRVSPDGTVIAVRWPAGPGNWASLTADGWHGMRTGWQVEDWPRLVPGGVPQDGPGEDADGHPT